MHHFRAEDGVLIEQVGDALRELEAFEPVRVVVEIARDGGEPRPAREPGEQRRHGPCEPLAREALRTAVSEHCVEQFLDKRTGKREQPVRPNAEPPRQLHAEPALHALALDNDHLGLERAAQGTPGHLREHTYELFQAIAAVDEHRRPTSLRSALPPIKSGSDRIGHQVRRLVLAAAPRRRYATLALPCGTLLRTWAGGGDGHGHGHGHGHGYGNGHGYGHGHGHGHGHGYGNGHGYGHGYGYGYGHGHGHGYGYGHGHGHGYGYGHGHGYGHGTMVVVVIVSFSFWGEGEGNDDD